MQHQPRSQPSPSTAPTITPTGALEGLPRRAPPISHGEPRMGLQRLSLHRQRRAARYASVARRLAGPCQHPRLFLLFQPIALALDHQGVAVMEQAIENGRGQDLVAEDRAPLRDDLIRRNQQAAAFVAAGDELEEEMRAAPLKRQIPELVDDQELRLAEEHQPSTSRPRPRPLARPR